MFCYITIVAVLLVGSAHARIRITGEVKSTPSNATFMDIGDELGIQDDL